MKNRFQHFTRFLKAFWLPKWIPKPPKMMPQFINNACFFQVCFHTVFSSILGGFLIAFPSARPSISLLFTMNSWGAFFSQSPKMYPKWPSKVSKYSSKNASRSLQKSIKTRSQKKTWKITEFGCQYGTKMKRKCVPNVCPEASRNGLDVNLRFVLGFGGPLGRFWAPSGHRSAILGSVWPPSGQLFGSLWKLLC